MDSLTAYDLKISYLPIQNIRKYSSTQHQKDKCSANYPDRSFSIFFLSTLTFSKRKTIKPATNNIVFLTVTTAVS